MTPELAEAYATIERMRGLADDFAREAREARAQVRQLRARLVECRPWVGVCPLDPIKIVEMCIVRDLADDTLEEIAK